jgi:WD40 repeat protein
MDSVAQIERRVVLKDWLRFVRSESHVFTHHPNLVFQQAANQHDRSSLSSAAALRWKIGKEPRAWLRWLNKPRTSDPCLLTLAGHSSIPARPRLAPAVIRYCSFSPDGTKIVSASEDGTLRLWNSETGAEFAVLRKHQNSVTCGVFSPDGKEILSASTDGTLRLWDAKTGTEIGLVGYTGWIDSCAFSPDGLTAVTGGEALIYWDLKNGSDPVILTGGSIVANVTSCVFSPDGERIVATSRHRTVSVWDVKTRERLMTLEGHSKWVNSCAYSPDSQRIVSASDDGTLILWDANTGAVLNTLRHSGAVQGCAFSPDGRRIASASADRTIKLWNAETGVATAILKGHAALVSVCSFSPDGQRIVSASADNTVKVWDAEHHGEGSSTAGHSARVQSCVYSPDGQRILTAAGDQTLRVWQSDNGAETSILAGYPDAGNYALYSPCGKRIALAHYDGRLTVLDAENESILSTFTVSKDRVMNCDWSPDGRRLTTATSYRELDGRVDVYDVQNGSLVWTQSQTGHASSANYSSDGRRIVSASFDRTVRIWDASTGKQLKTLIGNTDKVSIAAYSPDGLVIVSGAVDGTVRLWNARSGDQLSVLRGHRGMVHSCSISPDGKWIVSTSVRQDLYVWNSQTGEPELIFPDAFATAWGQGGGFLAAGTDSGAMRILQLVGLDPGIPIVTLVHLFSWDSNTYECEPKARCERCSRRFTPTQTLIDSIDDIVQTSQITPEQSPCAELPLEAWEDSRLAATCPLCNAQLRFNPFIVDNRTAGQP